MIPSLKAARLLAAVAATALSATLAIDHAKAEGNLTVYCSPQEEWCQLMVNEFQKATGIKVAMTRKSSGETFAQIKAEAANPQGRHLVGRHRRPAPAGRRGGPDRSPMIRR